MLKNLIQGKILGRLYESASGLVRHAAGWIGGYLTAQGVVTAPDGSIIDAVSVESAALTLLAVAWSLGRKWLNTARLGGA